MSDREEAATKLKDAIVKETKHTPVDLDDLIEMLNADDLRNVTGMLRPKGQGGGVAE